MPEPSGTPSPAGHGDVTLPCLLGTALHTFPSKIKTSLARLQLG